MSYDNFSKFYDSLMQNADYEKRAEYYTSILSSYGVNKEILLDLGCGTGTMSVLMADKGYDVIGVDSSVGMLMEARKKAFDSGKDILLLNQSMDEIDLYGTVDATISVLDCINHLENEEMVKRTFAKVSLFTSPGGVFAFDVNTIYKHREILADNAYIIENDNVFCAWQNNLQKDDSVEVNLDFFEEEDGVYYRESESFTEKAYNLDDISSWLNETGFDVKNIYDDMTFDCVKANSQRAVFVAIKR